MEVVLIIAALAYMGTGLYLWPRFALQYKKEHDERWEPLRASEGEVAFAGFCRSIVWPVFLASKGVAHYVSGKLQEEAERVEREKEIARQVAKYRAIEELRPRIEDLAFKKHLATTEDEIVRHNRLVVQEKNQAYGRSDALSWSEVAGLFSGCHIEAGDND